MAADPLIRSEVHYEGHVQGVGFRYTAQNTAKGYQVVGYVRNLPDGRVELIAEGEKGEMDRFLADLSLRMERHVRKQDRKDVPPTGEFTSFSVRM